MNLQSPVAVAQCTCVVVTFVDRFTDFVVKVSVYHGLLLSSWGVLSRPRN